MNKKDRAVKIERQTTIKAARKLAHGVLTITDGAHMLRGDSPEALELLTADKTIAKGTILARLDVAGKKDKKYRVRRVSGQVVWLNDIAYGNELQKPFTLRSLRADGFMEYGTEGPKTTVPAKIKTEAPTKTTLRAVPAPSDTPAPKIGRKTETFEPGTRLTGTYKGVTYTIIRNEQGGWDSLANGSDRFASLNEAAMKLLGVKAINAPKFWGLRPEAK